MNSTNRAGGPATLHGSAPPRPKVGLLAGSGRLPILFAEAARRQGYEVCCVGVAHEAGEDLRAACDTFQTEVVSKLGGFIRRFKRQGVRRIVMAGKVSKTVMYVPWRFVAYVPDRRFLAVWIRHLRRDKKDDTLTLQIMAEFEKDGLTFGSALEFCPELLVKQGILTRRAPSASERRDIAFGWTMAKEMGRLDVGQSVAVKEQATIAIEAIEGTDRCIARAGELCRNGGWTLVKVAKPQQDMRFDVPTVGVATIENLRKANARVLAIEAGKTIVVDQGEVIALADRYGIAIVALDEAEVDQAVS
jgi:DUF1009 family protein